MFDSNDQPSTRSFLDERRARRRLEEQRYEKENYLCAPDALGRKRARFLGNGGLWVLCFERGLRDLAICATAGRAT